MDTFPGERRSVPVDHMELEVRCLKNKSHEGSCYTRMFIISASYSYFFLISPKICLMGMQPATSCSAPGPVCPSSALGHRPGSEGPGHVSLVSLLSAHQHSIV